MIRSAQPYRYSRPVFGVPGFARANAAEDEGVVGGRAGRRGAQTSLQFVDRWIVVAQVHGDHITKINFISSRVRLPTPYLTLRSVRGVVRGAAVAAFGRGPARPP